MERSELEIELEAAKSRIRELELEIAGGEPEFEHPALRYVTVQVDRGVWEECRRNIAEYKGARHTGPTTIREGGQAVAHMEQEE